MTKYSELLKNPKWQKRRLQIMERDDFKCQCCSQSEKMLVVHHLWYQKNKKPWEYPDHCLLTLCQNCHELEHEQDALLKNEELPLLALKSFGIPSLMIGVLLKKFSHFEKLGGKDVYKKLYEINKKLENMGLK